MLSKTDLAIARAHAEHAQDDLVLSLLDHIQEQENLLKQAQRTPKPKPAPAKPKRPDWYPKEHPKYTARKP